MDHIFEILLKSEMTNFPAGYDVSVIIPPTKDYTSSKLQQDIIGLDVIAAANTRFENMTINWMKAYMNWGNHSLHRTYFNFNENITAFLTDYPMFQADINYNTKTKMVDSSRVVFFYETTMMPSIKQKQ